MVWEERVSFIALILVAAALALGGRGWDAWKQVTLWGLWVLAAALLLRRGWLKLFGPVLFFDMLCLARRSRYFWLRMAYAALLVTAVVALATLAQVVLASRHGALFEQLPARPASARARDRRASGKAA